MRSTASGLSGLRVARPAWEEGSHILSVFRISGGYRTTQWAGLLWMSGRRDSDILGLVVSQRGDSDILESGFGFEGFGFDVNFGGPDFPKLPYGSFRKLGVPCFRPS